MSNRMLVLILISILLLTACASGPKGYRKKKKKCDCPSWSYHQLEQQTNQALLAQKGNRNVIFAI